MLSSPLLNNLCFLASIVGVFAQCKTYPGDALWPSVRDWNYLNTSVNGRLLGPVVPLAAPCHYGGLGIYDSEMCNNITAQWGYTSLHQRHPTDIMSPIFTNNTCVVGTDPATPCTIGYFPVYVVNVTNDAEVAETIAFARIHNLRLNIKNTGHDFLGKSTARGSLSIWTHYLKSIEYNQLYEGKTNYSGAAFKIGSGVQSEEIYDAANAVGKMVVAGEQPTVGYGGGYLSAGGHSPLSSLYGMGADSVLEFTIVLANSTIVHVDQYTHPDLYWAVRGGGGSTFGVVTSWTVKAHEGLPATEMHVAFETNNTIGLWAAISKFVEIGPCLCDEGIYSYYFPTSTSLLIAPLFAPNKTLNETNLLLKPFFDVLDSYNISYVKNATEYASFEGAWKGTSEVPTFYLEFVGREFAAMSRLIPRETVENNLTSLMGQIKKFSKLADEQLGGRPVLFNMAPTYERGGELSNNSVNPAWRKAAMHYITGYALNINASNSENYALKKKFVVDEFQSFRDLTPDSGCYINESSDIEPNWQQCFFGDFYQRLLKIKTELDPTGVFYATKAVGSEAWTVEDGILCAA